MTSFVRVMISTMMKEFRAWRRNKTRLLLVILLPVLFYIAFNILMGAVYYSAGIQAALVVEETEPGYYTNGLVGILGEHDEIPPSLNLLPVNRTIADKWFDNSEVLLVIIIPEGFEEALTNNQSTSIQIRVNNLHEDATKNLRMPVMRKLDIFYQRYLPNDTRSSFEYELLYSSTPPRLAYMAWTIAIFAVMYSGIYIAGSAMTQEFENDTLNELVLSNQSPNAIYGGKMLTGALLSYVAVPVLFVLSWSIYGTWPLGDIATFLILNFGLALFSSGMGLILGAIFRNSVYLVPLSSLSGIFYWIVSGGIAPVELAGISFEVLNEYSPISNVFRSLIAMYVKEAYTTCFIDIFVILAFGLAAVIIAPILAQKLCEMNPISKVKLIQQKLFGKIKS